MTEWPKNPAYNQIGGALEPAGPVNVFNEKVAVAEAVNRAIITKTKYDETHPATPPAITTITPSGTPISAGSRPQLDESRYMIDVAAAHRRR